MRIKELKARIKATCPFLSYTDTRISDDVPDHWFVLEEWGIIKCTQRKVYFPRGFKRDRYTGKIQACNDGVYGGTWADGYVVKQSDDAAIIKLIENTAKQYKKFLASERVTELEKDFEDE